jgi:hypothetical protein
MNKLTSLVLLFTTLVCTAQTDSVRAKVDSSFIEGIYISGMDFRSNTPIKSDSFSVKNNNDSKDIYTKLASNSQFTCTVNGVKKILPTRSIWGYYSNRKLYVQKDKKFFLVTYPGTISFFIATNQETEFNTTRISNDRSSPFYNSYRTSVSSAGLVLRPYLISNYNGKVIKGKPSKLENLIKNDPEIYQEFRKLEPIDLSEMKSLVLKYNARHPLYILKDN